MRYSSGYLVLEYQLAMVVGVDEKARRSGLLSEEFMIPEFGRVNLDWLDLSKKYKGLVYKLNVETGKQISEIIGFSANFEFSGIRNAYVDLFDTVGSCVMEMEKNTKPTDVALRYSRERWNMVDLPNRPGDNLKPWIKSEFECKFIAEKVVGLVAEQLKLSSENAVNMIIRINFKERTFSVLAEEKYEEQMPSGGFSPFVLPTESMLALAKEYGLLDKKERASQLSLEPASESTSSSEATDYALVSETNLTEASSSEQESSPVSEHEASPVSLHEASPVSLHEASPVSQQESSPVSLQDAVSDNEAAVNQAAGNQSLPKKHESLEKFIVRKEDRPVEKNTEVRRESFVEPTAKYASYSKSEIDSMLKQQTENITSALGSKISSQQRVFQEAVEKQEKVFAKLSDGFVAQFDQTRVRLENSSKQSEDNIHTELENFKRELSKELESYRAQINKSVVPVAKFIEDKNAKPVEKAQKEVAKQQQQSQLPADTHGLKPLLIVNVVLLLITLGTLFGVVTPELARMESFQSQLNEIKTKLEKPGSGSTALPSSSAPATSTPATSTPSN